MASTTSPLALDLALPWQIDQESENAFKRMLKVILGILLFFFIVVPFLPVFEKEYEVPDQEVPKTVIVMDPVKIEPEPEPEIEKPKPKSKPKPKPIPKETAPPVPTESGAPPKDAKKTDMVKEQGLVGLSQQLAAMRQSMDLTKLENKNVTRSEQGKVKRVNKTVLGQDQLTRKSEGIQVDDTLMSEQAVALAMHESTKLDGFISGGEGDTESADFYSSIRGQRSDESIRRVFEAGKSKVYMYYMRALNEKPGLAGTFVFEVLIEPSGEISKLTLVSSELNSPELEKLILSKLKQLNFGAEDVDPRKLTYKFNFLPG